MTTGTATVLPHWMPRVILIGLLLLLAAVAALRLSGHQAGVPPGAVVAERALRFDNTPDGAVAVWDARTGQTLAVMQGEQGFLRGVLRGLARERRAQAVGRTDPYWLRLHDDGRFVISDPQTGRFIELASFGTDNAAVFTRWLPLPTSKETLK